MFKVSKVKALAPAPCSACKAILQVAKLSVGSDSVAWVCPICRHCNALSFGGN